MEIDYGNNNSIKKRTSKNGFTKCNIPILEIPDCKDIFMLYMFNEELQTIQVSFINENSKIIKQHKIDNYAIEKRKNCKTDLTIGNLSFLVDKETNELLCVDCWQDKEKIFEVSKNGENNYENTQLVNKLRSYLENNKVLSTPHYIKIMEDLISYTDIIALLLDIFKKNKAFDKRCLCLQNYIDNLSSYLEIVNSVEMECLYLFLKNLVIISTCDINDICLKGFFKYYFKNMNSINVSEIQLKILKKIVDQNENDNFMSLDMAELKFKVNKTTFDNDFIRLNQDFSNIKIDLGQKKTSSLQKKLKIYELKRNIIDFLRTYNHSFNYLSSKKVLERKFINEILYLLFKYNHQRFKEIKLDDYLINSLQKEIQNIIRFLLNTKDSAKTNLIKKLNSEIDYLETKKTNPETSQKKTYSPKITSNKKGFKKEHIFISRDTELTEKEKALLNNYSLTTTQDSYTSIYASKLNDSKEIDYRKIQVILEFLFFIRDKSIFTIHLLNEASSLFFEFLTQYSSEKKIDKDNENDKNEIKEIRTDKNWNCDDEDYDIEELKKDYNFIFSEDHKEKNEKLYENLLVQGNENIDLNSALNYIFSHSAMNDYKNELNYLYENVVLPKHLKDQKFLEVKKEKQSEDYALIENKIDSVFKQLDDKFKNDPLYVIFIKYFETERKEWRNNNSIETQQLISFYEKYVDNFCDFKDISIMKRQIKEYIEQIDSRNSKLEMLEIIKEKYNYIEKELRDSLIPNQENYQKYYEQWKEKNEKLVVANYELKDLIKDIRKLIPDSEKIKIIGKDRRNFTLILYMFQCDYFLKDYI